MLQTGIENYQSSHVRSASPGKLVVLTYNALISSLVQTKKIIEEKAPQKNGDGAWIEKSHKQLSKAMEILTELIKALNFKQGGDIAKNLYSLYMYIYELVVEADVQKTTEPVDKSLNFLILLRDAFEEADKEFRKENRRQKAG